jgi:hypothetical protein
MSPVQMDPALLGHSRVRCPLWRDHDRAAHTLVLSDLHLSNPIA